MRTLTHLHTQEELADEIARGGVTHGKLSQAVVALETSSVELRAARAALTRSETAREQLEESLEAERREHRQLSASGSDEKSRHNPLLWPWRGASGRDERDAAMRKTWATLPSKLQTWLHLLLTKTQPRVWPRRSWQQPLRPASCCYKRRETPFRSS